MTHLAAAFDALPTRVALSQVNRGMADDRCMDTLTEGVTCLFLRQAGPIAQFTLPSSYSFAACSAGGWLLKARDVTQPDFWSPHPLIWRKLDADGHVLQERPARIAGYTSGQEETTLSVAPEEEGWLLDSVLWRFEGSVKSLVTELETLAPVETQGYFLLGSHTRYGKPADLYRHLVHGWIYEDRYAWPHKRRICSENDAHALYLIFSGLQLATGKRIYALLKAQLLLSVLARQSADGGFRHGEWTDGMESHYRLHCSAMHLMMDALSEVDEPVVREALARAMHFISDKRDETAIGSWFYHDELESSLAGMQRTPFKWWPSNVLGKAPQNMLVLNTQLDTLVALDRYQRITGDAQYAAIVASGFAASRAVLELQPMEWLYRLIFSAIDLTLLPTEKAARLPAWQRAWKRFGWQVFIPRLPNLKTRYPRLVMPGGYIDRELSLQTWAFDYLSVNLMDLVRAARGGQRDALMPYVNGILDHCARTGIALRWLENKGRAYALGFLAEALTLLCLRESRPELDAMLAESLMLCVQHGQGLPPSLLGGNAEARESLCYDVPRAALPDIVVANLSTSMRRACLVVNAGNRAIALHAALDVPLSGWRIPADELPPGAWRRLEA